LEKGKEFIRLLVPPLMLIALKKIFIRNNLVWKGDYSNWEAALNDTTGYDTDLILETCKNSLLKVKSGEKAYERDSVLFDEIEYSWGLLAGLLSVALDESRLSVLDFGGSLGSTYFQNKSFLSNVKSLNWNIVEQKHFVDCGIKYFSDNTLRFYYSSEECISINSVNVLLLCSVLQYLQNPIFMLKKLLDLNIPTIIIDRTGFVQKKSNRLTIQNVPKSIYSASYPCWFFSESHLISIFNEHGYEKTGDWSNTFQSNIGIFKGFIFKKKL
jgi:putative methyltransferase (TIGR04325 family)